MVLNEICVKIPNNDVFIPTISIVMNLPCGIVKFEK